MAIGQKAMSRSMSRIPRPTWVASASACAAQLESWQHPGMKDGRRPVPVCPGSRPTENREMRDRWSNRPAPGELARDPDHAVVSAGPDRSEQFDGGLPPNDVSLGVSLRPGVAERRD
jgi:hypothetical protein